MTKFLPLVCAAFLFSLSQVMAATEGETLQMTLPEGYEKGFSDGNAQQQIVEFVPIGQSVQDWQELLTVQVFYGLNTVPARQFAQTLMDRAADSCAGAAGNLIRNEPENGYDVSLFMVSCPGDGAEVRPEWTIFKGIAGKDSFYLVHKAWAYRPDREAVVEWSQFLYGVGLCDTRRDDAPCIAKD